MHKPKTGPTISNVKKPIEIGLFVKPHSWAQFKVNVVIGFSLAILIWTVVLLGLAALGNYVHHVKHPEERSSTNGYRIN